MFFEAPGGIDMHTREPHLVCKFSYLEYSQELRRNRTYLRGHNSFLQIHALNFKKLLVGVVFFMESYSWPTWFLILFSFIDEDTEAQRLNGLPNVSKLGVIEQVLMIPGLVRQQCLRWWQWDKEKGWTVVNSFFFFQKVVEKYVMTVGWFASRRPLYFFNSNVSVD